MHRILIPIDSHNQEAWEYALAYANKISETTGKKNDVVLLVHTKQQLNHTDLAHHIGTRAAKALSSGKSISLQSGSVLRFATLRTLGRTLNNTVIIAYFADDKMLENVDDRMGLVGIVAVPDLPGDADQWSARWSPIVHGEQKREAAALIDDPVVESALQSLTQMVNLSTGLGNPRDKDMADEILRILRYKNHQLEPTKLRSWAIQNGWKSDGARDLEKLARKIWALKNKPSMAKIYNWKERHARWQDET